MDKIEKLEEGTMITATMESGTILGDIAGIASELGPLGFVYIIKITSRSGKAWEEYRYSCVVMPRAMFQLASTQPFKIDPKDVEDMRLIPCPRCGQPINKDGICKTCGHLGFKK